MGPVLSYNTFKRPRAGEQLPVLCPDKGTAESMVSAQVMHDDDDDEKFAQQPRV
jgi:hypothetical protein